MASPFIELEVGGRTVKVTNPEKVYFPARGETKLDLIQYFIAVGDGIVRALLRAAVPAEAAAGGRGRRGDLAEARAGAAAGLDRDRARHVSLRAGTPTSSASPSSRTWSGPRTSRRSSSARGRRADAIPRSPDELRIDIDPQPGTGFEEAKRVAAVVHETLDEIGYVGWPKTSGNRGVHVYCRIEPNWDFKVVRRCALAFAREIERRAPDLVTTAWWKEERGEKVFVDYNQNARDRTILSAYSVRGRPDATVSAPVRWDELPDVATEDFTIATMPPRFAELGDLHAGIDDAVCDLRVLLEWVEREESAGVGEAPYPPNFPKMPGEPKRVQPSRAKKQPDDS